MNSWDELSQLSLYIVAAVLLAITPGPGIIYVAARTLAGGRIKFTNNGEMFSAVMFGETDKTERQTTTVFYRFESVLRERIESFLK